ncbi:MAG: ammonium transporter [Dehalococcoidia bacterium]|jgi:Amt family ammonium transporter|nr:ammonium transporter [Dehalococcoidia bacterium]
MDSGATAWILTSSALVLLMTPGLAFFYGGMVRAKNILAMLLKNYIAMGVITIVWTLVGGSLAFGHLIGGDPMTISDTIVLGNLDYFGLRGIADGASIVEGIPNSAFLMFQLMFAIITPALIVGAVAERMKFGAWTLFIIVWSILVYVPLTTAVWGGGYMAELGALDFAGGLVVHINAGVAALVLAVMIGPRLGYGSRAMRPHSLPLTMLGAGLLWFGWFGFNAGSALAADQAAADAFMATQVAAGTAATAWLLVEKLINGHTTTLGFASGAVAGLVAITPAAGFVDPFGALIIGLAAGAICFYALKIKSTFNFDDSLDVVAVHLVGGVVGSLLVGILAVDGVGGGEQFGIQLISVLIAIVFTGVLTFVIATIIDRTIGLRAGEDDEQQGLDLRLHNEQGYVLTE